MLRPSHRCTVASSRKRQIGTAKALQPGKLQLSWPSLLDDRQVIRDTQDVTWSA